MKKKYDGFYKKASNIDKLHRSENVLTIYREYDPDSYKAFDILANHVAEVFRNDGYIVLRKSDFKIPPTSYNFCKGFVMNLNGVSFALAHQENNKAPKEWFFNENGLDRVDKHFCASPFVYEVLKSQAKDYKFDTSRLINISPNGVDASIFHYDVEAKPKDKFTFLFVGAVQPRKGTDILVRAFQEEFGDDEPVELLIKNYDYGQTAWIESIINQKNVKTITADWSYGDLAKLYRSVALNGAFVNPFRAEAFGLPIFEALACGAPVGVSNWGGASHMLPSIAKKYKGMITLFDGKMSKSSFHNNRAQQYYKDIKPRWFEPDKEAVKLWMREMYENKVDGRTARACAKYIANNYSFKVRTKEFKKELVKHSQNTNIYEY
jgi:glycosyltransferase involved in cell wall biosynthesis